MEELPESVRLPSGVYYLLSANRERVQFQQRYPSWWTYRIVHSCSRVAWAAGNPFNHKEHQ